MLGTSQESLGHKGKSLAQIFSLPGNVLKGKAERWMLQKAGMFLGKHNNLRISNTRDSFFFFNTVFIILWLVLCWEKDFFLTQLDNLQAVSRADHTCYDKIDFIVYWINFSCKIKNDLWYEWYACIKRQTKRWGFLYNFFLLISASRSILKVFLYRTRFQSWVVATIFHPILKTKVIVEVFRLAGLEMKSCLC